MTDAPVPAAPKQGMNPILKWILIGCGTLVLLMILVFASCTYFIYHKAKEAKAKMAEQGVTFDTSHGLKGMAYSGALLSVQGMRPAVLMSLPKEDQAAANKAFSDLSAKSGSFTDEDMNDVGKAMDAYSKSMNTYQEAHHTALDPDAAKKFVSDLQAIADRH